MMEQMKKSTGMTGVSKAKIEQMLTGLQSEKFLSQIEPKRADLQSVGFDAQRQEMYVQ